MKLFICRTDLCGRAWETVRKRSPVREMVCKCCEPTTAVREPKWSSMVRNIYAQVDLIDCWRTVMVAVGDSGPYACAK